jgi:SH3 domain-containing protein 21
VKPPIGTKIINTSSASLKSTSITSSAFRKNSFGSKDSLNESTDRNSGIFGNVAAHRRSLETKSFENSIEKPPRKSLIITDANKTPSDIRKSLENLDEGKKTSTPPPVLTKKPTVPIKKSPSVSTVAGSIFSGIKQRVKSVENKLNAADGTDGTGSSKMSVADNGEKGVVGEKINELDTVERGTGYLQDVRQNRAKAPKRRPPTHSSGDSNNNVSLNGSHLDTSNDSITHEIVTSSPAHTSTTLEEEQVKPKAREWEKHKAPWMEELKANQARKTSPNIENKTSPDDEKHDMSKSFSSSFNSHSQSPAKTEIRASSLDVKSNSFRDESTATTKSTTKISITENSSSVMTSKVVDETTNNLRPTSVNLRNRSISPIPRISQQQQPVKPSPTPISSNVTATHITTSATTATSSDYRVNELEQRVNKLETLISTQNGTIEELRRMLREESDKVKTLKSDLEKYAQCFTQV